MLFTVALVAVAAWGATHLQITPDNRIFYGKGNQYFLDFLKFESDYVSSDTTLFVLSSPNTLADSNFANATRWLTEEAWTIDRSIRVDSVSTYPLATSEGDDIFIGPILDYICPSHTNCSTEKLSLLDRPGLINRLVSGDYKATGVLVTFSIEVGALGQIEEVNRGIEAIKSRFESNFPEIEIVVTGAVPMMNAFASTSSSDLGLLLPISLAIIGILLFLILGGVFPAALLLVVGLVAAAVTLGLAGWAGHVVNSATSIVPLVVFTLVIASSMHIVIHFLRQAEGRSGRKEIRDALKAAVEANYLPMIVSSATSILSLLSLSLVDSPPLSQLGQLSALGVLVGTCFALVILPLLLSTAKQVSPSKLSSAVQRQLNSYSRTLDQGKSFAVISLVCMAPFLAGLPPLEFDDDFVEYFSESTDFRRSTDRATELLAGPNHIEVLLENLDEEGVFNPSYIKYLGELTDFLRSKSLVSNATSFYDVLEDLSHAFGREISEVQSSDEFAQWYLTYELSLERGQSTSDFIRRDQKETRVSVLLGQSSSAEIKLLEREIYEWHENRQSQFSILVTGENIPVAHLSAMNISSMIWGLGACITFTAFLIGLLLKNARIGVGSLLATIVPVALGFGAWGLMGQNVGLASTAIIALTIGIVIDDAVHMVYRFVDGRHRLMLSGWGAAAYSVHRVGNAVATTSIVMIGGLGVLTLSPFEVNSSFGASTCIIIAFALLFDLFVFPRILVWADNK